MSGQVAVRPDARADRHPGERSPDRRVLLPVRPRKASRFAARRRRFATVDTIDTDTETAPRRRSGRSCGEELSSVSPRLDGALATGSEATLTETQGPRIETLEHTETYGKFVVEPLERGLRRHAWRTPLRRVLLSSLAGRGDHGRRASTACCTSSPPFPGCAKTPRSCILNLKDLAIKVRGRQTAIRGEDAESRRSCASTSAARAT